MEETRKELWKPLLWNNEPTNYRVSTFGRIQNIKTKRYLKIHEQNNGYYGFTISVNNKAHSMKIAKVVALYFIPNDDPIHKTEVDHLGGTETKDDNSIYNLEWVTPDENKRRVKEKNLYKGHVGDQNPNALYSNEEISYLCELLENNEDSLEDLIKKTGVKADVIYDIYNGTRWKSISKYFNIKNYDKLPQNSNKKHSESQIREACELIDKGYKNKDIINMVGISKDCIKKLRRGKTFHKIAKDYEFYKELHDLTN